MSFSIKKLKQFLHAQCKIVFEGTCEEDVTYENHPIYQSIEERIDTLILSPYMLFMKKRKEELFSNFEEPPTSEEKKELIKQAREEWKSRTERKARKVSSYQIFLREQKLKNVKFSESREIWKNLTKEEKDKYK